MRFRGSLYLALFGILLGPQANAQQKTAPWSQPRFSPDAKAFYDGASAVPVSTGADVIVLSDESSYVFDADGGAQVTRYLAYKILTQKGASGWGSTEQNWEPWRETKPTIKVRVITPDYVIHDLDQKIVTDSAAKDDDEDVYGDSRVVRAPFPAIAVGSVVEEEDSNTQSPDFAGSGMNMHVYPTLSVPVAHASIILDAPGSLPLRYAVRPADFVKPGRTESNGRVSVAFNFNSLEPYDDAEPNLPSDAPAYSEVLFSTAASWKDVATSYSRIVDAKLSSPEVKPLVTRILAGKSSREQKLDALVRYLAKEIRYTGIEFGDAAIVPHSPAETLKQKYGDCKDKSTLLVAMLRAADIPAYVALLNAGRREDVVKDLPGMGRFDHAIVYVPGSPDYWIDATDQYARLGQIPASDQGRLALIARPETDSLTPTAVTASNNNVELEERHLLLAENGPAHVIETSAPQGTIESEFRSYYADQQEKDFRKGLAEYVKGQYLAEKLDRATHSDPADLTKSFQLVVESSNAKRGFTELDSAVVAVRINGIFHRLPNDLLEKEEDDKSPDAAKDKPKKPRTADYQLPEPFVTEWRYSIQPPLGYRVKPLPANSEVHVGPALLTEQFSSAPDGTVSAVVRFDTVQSRFTAQEIKELRQKVVELRDGQPVMIYFEPLALALLNEGKPREAFQAYRDLISRHPKEAVHHLQKAVALLQAGLGGAARAEALSAAKLEPASALAQKTLAQILESDLVGRKMARGADFAGATAALRAAKKLDPDDHEISGDLAILLEYNAEGERYGPGSKLKESIAEYRSLTPEQLADIGLKGNLPYTLFYAAEFQDARKTAEDLNPQADQVVIAAEAAMHGGAAGIAEARRRASAEAKQKELLRNAGQMLLHARIYPPAADLFEAGAAGENASATLAFAATLRKLRKHEGLEIKPDASGFMLNFFVMLCEGKLDVKAIRSISSKNARAVMDKTDPEELEKSAKIGKQMRQLLSRQGSPPDVVIDILMQVVEPSVEGHDTNGYRVTMRIPGSRTLIAYIVKEDGNYKIIDTSETPNAVGLQILDALEAGNLAAAKLWLDWVREDQHLAGGDDPLAGRSFPRLWTKGRDANGAQMKVAAAGLLVLKKETADRAIPILEAAKDSATTDSEKLNLTLALLEGYSALGDSEKVLLLAAELYKQYPESRQLFLTYESSLRDLKKFAEADAFAEERLKRLPKDLDALRAKVANAVAMENYPLVLDRERAITDSGKAEAFDWNGLAWYSLFIGKASAADLDAANKASRLAQNDASILHTIGSLYAELG